MMIHFEEIDFPVGGDDAGDGGQDTTGSSGTTGDGYGAPD